MSGRRDNGKARSELFGACAWTAFFFIPFEMFNKRLAAVPGKIDFEVVDRTGNFLS